MHMRFPIKVALVVDEKVRLTLCDVPDDAIGIKPVQLYTLLESN